MAVPGALTLPRESRLARSIAVALVCCLALPAPSLAAPYRWVDPQGNVQYSDQPPQPQQEQPPAPPREPQQTQPSPPRANSPGVDLGTRWDAEFQGGWTGVWTRRGASDVFDAVWTQGREKITAVLTIAITGRTVRVASRQSSENEDCDYVGTLAADGVTVSGTATCTVYRGPWTWRARIRR